MRKKDNPFEVEDLEESVEKEIPVEQTETVSTSTPRKKEYVINQWGEYFWKEI